MIFSETFTMVQSMLQKFLVLTADLRPMLQSMSIKAFPRTAMNGEHLQQHTRIYAQQFTTHTMPVTIRCTSLKITAPHMQKMGRQSLYETILMLIAEDTITVMRQQIQRLKDFI